MRFREGYSADIRGLIRSFVGVIQARDFVRERRRYWRRVRKRRGWRPGR